MLSEKEKLESIASLGIELNQINDLDILLERVLFKARQWVNADAGSIYIRDEEKLNFEYSQNDTLQSQLSEGEKLIYSTFTIPINDKSIAGYVALTGLALNLPDVYNLPSDVSYHFSSEFDDTTGYKTHSMLTIPAELRDPKETGAHVNRVAGYAVELYEKWAHRRKIPREEIDKNRDILRMAAMLHDVGKVATSDIILKKPGPLSDEEFEIMKQHTLHGARLFLDRQTEVDGVAGVVALNHHERWDGGKRGYPGHVEVESGEPLTEKAIDNGAAKPKKGEEIPLFGRIVAIADVYDALSSARCYKEPFDEERVLKILKEEAGKQFDPELVEIFLEMLDTIKSIRDRYPS
jgi:response regulator RpfG family c-di-GMP phosphodiesterase